VSVRKEENDLADLRSFLRDEPASDCRSTGTSGESGKGWSGASMVEFVAAAAVACLLR